MAIDGPPNELVVVSGTGSVYGVALWNEWRSNWMAMYRHKELPHHIFDIPEDALAYHETGNLWKGQQDRLPSIFSTSEETVAHLRNVLGEFAGR